MNEAYRERWTHLRSEERHRRSSSGARERCAVGPLQSGSRDPPRPRPMESRLRIGGAGWPGQGAPHPQRHRVRPSGAAQRALRDLHSRVEGRVSLGNRQGAGHFLTGAVAEESPQEREPRQLGPIKARLAGDTGCPGESSRLDKACDVVAHCSERRVEVPANGKSKSAGRGQLYLAGRPGRKLTRRTWTVQALAGRCDRRGPARLWVYPVQVASSCRRERGFSTRTNSLDHELDTCTAEFLLQSCGGGTIGCISCPGRTDPLASAEPRLYRSTAHRASLRACTRVRASKRLSEEPCRRC